MFSADTHCLPLCTHITSHCSTGLSIQTGAILHRELRRRFQRKRQVQLLAETNLDAGDSVIPTDLAPLRSLGPGESEELATDPSLLVASGSRHPPPPPPGQNSGRQVGDLAIDASRRFFSSAAGCHMAVAIYSCGRLANSRGLRLKHCRFCLYCCVVAFSIPAGTWQVNRSC